MEPGTRLRQYELIRELGRGGMGTVYLARDTKLERMVAIKFLDSTSRDMTRRFLAEGRTTAALAHDNIVAIYEVDEHAGTPHMVLEFLDGATLREVMRDGKLSPARVIELVVPIVRAVAFAHAAGVVHRDLKPENIFVTASGVIKVLDFGIAKARVDTDAPTQLAAAADLDLGGDSVFAIKAGAVIGTPQYMAPEQLGLDEIDDRVDQWAIGIMMFELLAGRHPIDPFTMQSLLAQFSEIDTPMPKLAAAAGGVPATLASIVDRCLAKRPEARFHDAKALLEALEAVSVQPAPAAAKVASARAHSDTEPMPAMAGQPSAALASQPPAPAPATAAASQAEAQAPATAAAPQAEAQAPATAADPARPRGFPIAIVAVVLAAIVAAIAYLATA